MHINAYILGNEMVLRDARTGNALPFDWAGYCQVLFTDGITMIFQTGLTESGERFWQAVDR